MADRTAKARIRDAALAHFATEGFSASVKDIAADAGVSAPLVMHHFTSKDGLRVACDDYVAELIRDRKVEAVEAGTNPDPIHTLRDLSTDPVVFRYLIRTLTEGSEHVNSLVDQLVDNAMEYTQMGIDRGLVKPVENLRETTVVMTLWSLGTLVLHDHLRRLLDVDLVTGGSEDYLRWIQATMPIYSNGVIEPDYLQRFADRMADAIADAGPEDPHPEGEPS